MIPEPRVVDSGCNNRSKDDHSFLRKPRFFVLRDFLFRQFRRIVYSSEIIQNLCFSRILKSISPKHVCTPVKFYRFCQKSKIQVGASQSQPGESHWCKSRQDSHFPKITFGWSKSLRASRARARARTHTHTRYIF